MEMPAKKLGYGMMRLPKLKIDGKITMDYETVNHLVDAFMERGFQYFDTAFPYCKGCSEEAIRRCLTERYDRDSFYLTNKMSAHMLQHPEEVEPKFQEQLKNVEFPILTITWCIIWERKIINVLSNGGFSSGCKD